MIENSTQGLTLLDPDHEVVVTGEERHQAALRAWAPRPDGRARRVAAELGFVSGTRGRQVIEVRLDGRRVGTLTALMSQRYAPHVQEILRRRERPACVALVVRGRRGLVEMELHLPDVAGVPGPPVPPAGPRAPSRGPDGARPPARPGRRFRTPLAIGGGVFALLLVIGVVSGGGAEQDADAVPAVAAAAPTTRPAPTTTRVTPTPTPTPSPTPSPSPSPSPSPTLADVAAAAPARPAETTRAPAPPPAPPEPRREPAPAPAPEPQRAVAEPAGGGCHPSYSPCVPDGPDLDCGDLDGPYTVSGPDEFRLDRDDDGVGCE